MLPNFTLIFLKLWVFHGRIFVLKFCQREKLVHNGRQLIGELILSVIRDWAWLDPGNMSNQVLGAYDFLALQNLIMDILSICNYICILRILFFAQVIKVLVSYIWYLGFAHFLLGGWCWFLVSILNNDDKFLIYLPQDRININRIHLKNFGAKKGQYHLFKVSKFNLILFFYDWGQLFKI